MLLEFTPVFLHVIWENRVNRHATNARSLRKCLTFFNRKETAKNSVIICISHWNLLASWFFNQIVEITMERCVKNLELYDISLLFVFGEPTNASTISTGMLSEFTRGFILIIIHLVFWLGRLSAPWKLRKSWFSQYTSWYGKICIKLNGNEND